MPVYQNLGLDFHPVFPRFDRKQRRAHGHDGELQHGRVAQEDDMAMIIKMNICREHGDKGAAGLLFGCHVVVLGRSVFGS